MAELFSLVYLGLFACSGSMLARVLFYRERPLVRTWLGLVFGMAMLIWFPALFAFALGFTLSAQLCALALCCAIGIVSFALSRRLSLTAAPWRRELPALVACGLLFAFCCILLSTHVLRREDGALYVGQSTYGDLAMHLGFISSIAVQGTFPPMYSICPDAAVGYPFLSSSVGATFYLFGTSLRFATILTAAYAFLLVLFGAYCFFEEWLRQRRKAVFSTLLFFLGGGFGFWYFFDLVKDNPDNLRRVFTAFYETPTNFVQYGLRWVNPIADMLIPQRALLFGWSLLFACLFLLYRAAIRHDARAFAPLGMLAGCLPLIHTHSFLALGVISGFFFLRSLALKEGKAQLYGYLRYLAIALAFALPQLVLFTFRQSGSFLKFHFNWANESDSYIWFYVKNLGLLALLAPVAFLAAKKEDRATAAAVIPLWLIAELIQFQPNQYDNNKLLFVCFVFLCGLVGSWLIDAKDKLARGGAQSHVSTALLFAIVCAALFLSGTLTLARETVSEYQLIERDQVQAAEYVTQHAEPDATFLTYNNHNNCIASLTGRNIMCGSGTFLFFHGVDYFSREAALTPLYEEPSLYFNDLADKYGIDYVFLGPYERANYAVDYAYFAERFEVFYENDSVMIYLV